MSEEEERNERDATWMRVALEEARLAAIEGEVPVGCVIVDDETNALLARTRNARERTNDPTAHAEIFALQKAAASRGTFRIEKATLYVTLEPCPMCAGAIVNARIPRVVYGVADPKAGALHSMFGIGLDTKLNHRFEATAGVLADECLQALKDFFQALRASGKNGR